MMKVFRLQKSQSGQRLRHVMIPLLGVMYKSAVESTNQAHKAQGLFDFVRTDKTISVVRHLIFKLKHESIFVKDLSVRTKRSSFLQ